MFCRIPHAETWQVTENLPGIPNWYWINNFFSLCSGEAVNPLWFWKKNPASPSSPEVGKIRVGWVEGGAPEPIYCKNRARNPTTWGHRMLGFGEKLVFRIEMLFTPQPNLRASSYHNSPDGRPPRFWKPRRSILFAISIVRASPLVPDYFIKFHLRQYFIMRFPLFSRPNGRQIDNGLIKRAGHILCVNISPESTWNKTIFSLELGYPPLPKRTLVFLTNLYFCLYPLFCEIQLLLIIMSLTFLLF